MGCNCKDNTERIEQGKADIKELRELFIKRMTVDSETQDHRKKDFNQAIFRIESHEEVDSWNASCEKFGLQKKKYGTTYPIWNEIDMDMVLQCFDDAVKDWRRTFCDVENCNRK